MIPNEEENEKKSWNCVNMIIKNSSIKKENIKVENEITVGNINYYLAHCPNGIFNVKTYAKITIQNVYAGIDWTIYTSENGGIKHDFIVHPEANPDQIRLIYEGAGKFHMKNNRIHFENEYGVLSEEKLICYQENEKNKISSGYSVKKSEKQIENGFSYEVGIQTGKYNKDNILIIDPQLVWGTFYGGNTDDGFNSIDCDNAGNVYVASYSTSTNFPTQTLTGAYYSGVSSGGWDALLLKFSNTGVLLWATYYGGTGGEAFWSINVLNNGDFFVCGMSDSPNFPTQAWGTAYFNNTNSGGRDAVVLKFSSGGVRVWATYYGGTGWDEGFCITTDPNGNIYVTGTSGAAFPTQTWVGAFNDNLFGGSSDVFILRFSTTGVLDWATYYGGVGTDRGSSIYCDNGSNIYVTGDAQSGFPTQAGIGPFATAYYDGTIGGTRDAFVLRFSNVGALDWATFLGGPQSEQGQTIITTSTNSIYVIGNTDGGFPVIPGSGTFTGAYYDATYGGSTDAFIAHFSNSGLMDWATYYGGTASEYFPYNSFDHLEVDGCDNLYVTFASTSTNMNTHNPGCGSFFDGTYNGTGGFQPDGFLIKFSYTGTLLWASYISISNFNYRGALTTDSNNNLFVGGESSTGMTGFLFNPAGGAYYDNTHNGGTDDAFISKFTPAIPTKNQSQLNSSSCSPCNGSATINLTCSEPNYNYAWNNGSSTQNSTSATNTITGLCPGSYTVTATSNCNKTQTATFVITGTTCGGITATATSAVTCSGALCPTLTSSGASGTIPYTYLWSTGASTQNINPCPLSNTVYTVTITDVAGSTATATASVTVNPIITITITPTNITCSGSTNGSAQVNAGGGTAPYTYNWSNGGTTSNISNLTSQIYSVTVTDNKGCTTVSSVAIISPPPLSGLFTKGTANCTGCGCKEWIMVTSSGGTEPYSYTWPALGGYVNRYKNQLCPGAYTINIIDKNGCSINVNLTTP
ncbi:MAG: SBBP repeat-containing protein [Bacteroidetes bacterium]|nr:SBBP repeat-containing protein [Bacteroidota bacterium]